jgi:uracil-DNA glycosylase family 4
MFVGEGPGADEDAQGLPFVGKAGQLLNNMIGAMGLKREAGLHRQRGQVPPARQPHAGAR